MNCFYIKKVIANGNGKVPSEVSFIKGVNIIHGPSNTGKSYVLDCIDYAFGSDASKSGPPIPEEDGFDSVSMTIASISGGELTITRNFLKDTNNANVVSTIPDIKTGDYNIKNLELSSILLKLIDIDGPHKVFSNKEKSNQKSVTWRSFIHFFFLQEESIITKGPFWDSPKYSSVTACLSVLLYLIKEKECSVDEKEETKEVKYAKRTAVVNYIRGESARLEQELSELRNTLPEKSDEDVNGLMDSIISQINQTEDQIVQESKKNQSIIARKLKVEESLEEANALCNRYRNLAGQYEADMKRLDFIIAGQQAIAGFNQADTCPFCNHKLDEEHIQSFRQEAINEKSKTMLLLNDLNGVIGNLGNEIAGLRNEWKDLKNRQNEIAELISTDLKPRSRELHSIVEANKQRIELETKLEMMQSKIAEYQDEAQKKEDEVDKIDEYDPKSLFTDEELKTLDEYASEALAACSYPDLNSAIISRKDFDLEVNGKRKKDQGKGYRAYLNTLFAYIIQKYLYLHGKHAPRLLILDSPILSLNERKEITEEDRAPAGMRESLFRFLVSNTDLVQTIIVENEIPDIDYTGVNDIAFTKSDSGRYGFLNGVRE
ncbi:MAG: AAA family ATPase [Sphaerochaetaceae bacterium]